jgi:hypothetical protein
VLVEPDDGVDEDGDEDDGEAADEQRGAPGTMLWFFKYFADKLAFSPIQVSADPKSLFLKKTFVANAFIYHTTYKQCILSHFINKSTAMFS